MGPQPPSVYWRRRLLLVGSLVLLAVLLVLTARAVLGHDGGSSAAASDTSSTHPSPTRSTSSPPARSSSTPAGPSTTVPASGAVVAAPDMMPARCTPAQLSVQAVVGKAQYNVGDEPVLTLQVTNSGTAPCVQDVADSQIVLRVYNGASRVWGSHDCKIQPGVQDRTLEPGKPAGFSIVWSGLSAQPGCAGTRQRVGAGTYTLYAALAGHEGKAAQFTIK